MIAVSATRQNILIRAIVGTDNKPPENEATHDTNYPLEMYTKAVYGHDLQVIPTLITNFEAESKKLSRPRVPTYLLFCKSREGILTLTIHRTRS